MQQEQKGRVVRHARFEDVQDIAAVHMQAWRETYAHLLPARTLGTLNVEDSAARWARVLEEATADVWVATDGPAVIGWASARRSIDEDAPQLRLLESLYVLAVRHGNGTGQSPWQQMRDSGVNAIRPVDGNYYMSMGVSLGGGSLRIADEANNMVAVLERIDEWVAVHGHSYRAVKQDGWYGLEGPDGFEPYVPFPWWHDGENWRPIP